MKRLVLCVLCLAAIRVLIALPSRAQGQSDTSKPAFEVASVKPGDPNDRRDQIRTAPGGRFTTTNTTLKRVIEWTYRVQAYQISGGPDWLDAERYNIEAKPEVPMPQDPSGTYATLRLMVQTLLADRFSLKMHKETKDLPVYTLVVGKNGPGFQEGKDDEKPLCEIGRTKLTCLKVPMAYIAEYLSSQLGRNVSDQTGLSGKYDLTLEWMPDPGQQPMSGGPGSSEEPAGNPDAPDIFTALQEQLGLKLQAGKGPVDILVIDHVERPSEN